MPLIQQQKYSPWISLWKGLRPGLISLIPVVVSTLLGIVTPDMLVAFGVPTFLAVAIIEALRNALKYWKNNPNG